MTELVRLTEITKIYQGGVTGALNGVSLTVEEGEFTAVMGASGSGKSTLLNLVAGLDRPSSGNVTVAGLDLGPMGEAALARFRRDRIGFVFQFFHLLPNLTVLENVRVALQRGLGTSFHFWKREKTLDVLNARAMALLERVDLGKFARIHAGELAYGRKRTLEIATTLAMEPELMLLDEPTAGMGHEDVDRVKNLIKEVAVGRTVLMVEHNMSVVSGICDRITVLQRGAVLAEGPYAEVAANPQVMEAYMGTAHG